MILNLSKIKTEALLLFCRDLIQEYSLKNDHLFNIDNNTKLYIEDTIAYAGLIKNQDLFVF